MENIHVSAIRMDKALYQKLATVAKTEGRSVNQQIIYYIRQALADREDQKGGERSDRI